MNNIKKSKLVFTLLVMVLPAWVSAQSKAFTIDGKLESATPLPGKIYLIGQEVKKDSCELKDNTYHFSGTMQHPGAMVYITWCDAPTAERVKKTGSIKETGSIQLFFGPGKIQILHKMPFEKKEVTGSGLETDYAEVRKQIGGNMRNVDAVLKKYIRTHQDSWLSFMFLKDRQKSFGTATTDSLYQGLGPELKKDEMVIAFAAALNKSGAVAIGKTAPEFSLNNTEGQPVSLSSYRGKYVFVDFWASWCMPCRAENPTVKGLYNKYHDKGFNVLSVSLDMATSRQAWIDAIRKDGLTWTQVSDLKGLESPVAKMFGVTSIPANFLVDPSGKIIASNLRGYDLEKRIDQLMK